MRIIVTIAMILLSAQFAVAQPADPDGPKRLTLGVSTLHQFTVIGGYETNFVPLGLHAGWRLNNRIGLHADIMHDRESHGFDEYSGGEDIRTLRWWTGGATFHFNDCGRLRPHLLAGFEMLADSTNRCEQLRRRYPDEHCETFPHRRPGVNGGLGIDIPFGSRFFARFQYLTSVIYVYEVVSISHKTRLTMGVDF